MGGRRGAERVVARRAGVHDAASARGCRPRVRMRGWGRPLTTIASPSRPVIVSIIDTSSDRRGVADVGVGEHEQPARSTRRARASWSTASSTMMAPARPANTCGATCAVVVGVVPERARGMIGGDLVAVGVLLARVDHHEDVVAVAFGGDVQAVGVQVGRGVEPVVERHGEHVAGTDPQRRARGRAVVGERPALPPP